MSIIEDDKIKITVEIPRSIIDKNCDKLESLKQMLSNTLLNFYEEDKISYLDNENNIVYLDYQNFENILELDKVCLVIYNYENQVIDNDNETCNDNGTFVLEMTNFKSSSNKKKNLKQRLKSTEELLEKKEQLLNYYKSEVNFNNIQRPSLSEKKEFLKISQELEKLRADYNTLLKQKLTELNKDDKISPFTAFSQTRKEVNINETELKNEYQSNNSFINYSSYCHITNGNIDKELESVNFEYILEKFKLKYWKNEEVKNHLYLLVENFYKFLFCLNIDNLQDFHLKDHKSYVFNNHQYYCTICRKFYLISIKRPKILGCRHYACDTDDISNHTCL